MLADTCFVYLSPAQKYDFHQGINIGDTEAFKKICTRTPWPTLTGPIMNCDIDASTTTATWP